MSDLTAIQTSIIDPVTLIQNTDRLQDSTKEKYIRVLVAYLDTGADLGEPTALAAYAKSLSQSGRAFLKAAVSLWADRTATVVKGQATPDNVRAVDAAIHRLEALQDAIEVKAAKGRKAHTWLSSKQVKSMFDATGNGIEGDRDRAALGLLVAAGLRREEAVNITFQDIEYQPIGDRMRTVLSVKGKGGKDRVVPVSDQLAGHIDTWGKYVGHTGPIVRSLGRNREPGASMSAVGIFKLVRRYGTKIGKPDLAAHDLRRTYAQLGYQAGVPITQISVLLGHRSVQTTQKYLDLDVDLEATASDFVPWG